MENQILNSHGLSIYIPVEEGEFTEARKYALDGWKKIVNFQYDLTESDHEPPFIHSTVIDHTIKGHTNVNDVAKVTLWIYTSSLPEGNTAIYQELDPSSFIKSDGSFEYKWNKEILSLCNKDKLQHSCKPVSMNIEVNKNKKFALIPVRLQSNKYNFNEYASLKYVVNKGGNFSLLGARPEIQEAAGNNQQPIPKEDLAYST